MLKKFFLNQDYFYDLEDNKTSSILMNEIKAITFEDLFDIIKANETEIQALNSLNIPQFSSLLVLDKVLEVVNGSDHLNYELIGYYLNKDTTVVAQRKYGENHYKLTALMGLTSLDEQFNITPLGIEYMNLSADEKIIIRDKLFLRIPTIQRFLVDATKSSINGYELLSPILKESTITRRRSNINKIIKCVIEHFSREERLSIENNIIWK